MMIHLRASSNDLPLSASSFYNQVNDDYLQWSGQLNIHFGYFRWPHISHLFFLEKMLAAMNEEVQSCLDIDATKPALILDAGCGVGTSCCQMASSLQRASFIGVNISQKQIERGKATVSELGLQDRVTFLPDDFTKISLENNSCDAAFAIESACYGQGRAKSDFLREVVRVLKPGARLVVADGFYKNNRQLPTLIARLHRQNLHYWSMDELADIQLFTEEMKRVGFEVTEVKEISWQVAPSALYLPFTAIKIYIKRVGVSVSNWLYRRPPVQLSTHQKNYPKAIWLTLFLGIFRKYFGYYLVVGKKL